MYQSGKDMQIKEFLQKDYQFYFIFFNISIFQGHVVVGCKMLPISLSFRSGTHNRIRLISPSGRVSSSFHLTYDFISVGIKDDKTKLLSQTRFDNIQ